MKSYKKYIFILFVLFLPHQILAQEKEEKHTLAVTGIAIPIFLFTYHFGLSYDYLLTNSNKSLGFSVGAAGRYGYSSGVPGDDKLMSKSDFLRSDAGGKVWWYFDSNDTRVGVFFGLSVVYVRSTKTLVYEMPHGEPNVEVSSKLFTRVLPGYILGGRFQRKDSNWSFGFALGGLMFGTVDTTYKLPNDTMERYKNVKLGSEFFLEAFVGYSF